MGETAASRLARARLYVVSDARTRQGDLAAFLDAILDAGADIVQLREKTAEAGDLLRWAEVFRQAADRYGALFTVNDRADLAAACGADGVHVGQNDLPVEAAARVVGQGELVGLSCHSSEDHSSASPRADYLTAGPVWPTATKPGRAPTGLDLVRSAATHVGRPWFAIGGIGASNISQVVEAGATRVVVVRAVTQAPDPALAVRTLLAELPA